MTPAEMIQAAAKQAVTEWANDHSIDTMEMIDHLKKTLSESLNAEFDVITDTWPKGADRVQWMCKHPGVASFDDCPYCGKTILLDANGDEIEPEEEPITVAPINTELAAKIMARQRIVGRYRKARHPRAIKGGRFTIGATYNNQAVCLYPEVDRRILEEMFGEVMELNLARPIHIYGHTCTMWDGGRSFVFHQIDSEGNEFS